MRIYRSASYSMDTLLSSGNIRISPKLAHELLTHFDTLKIMLKDSEEQKLFSDYVRERFMHHFKQKR